MTSTSNAELLEIGHQCSLSTCNLVDFLPFKCQHCSQPYCGEHFLPKKHQCAVYDESKFDRVAPSCPLCSEPVSIPPGQDPNVRMERHISAECSVTTGKVKTSSVPHCAQPKCGKLLFAPIQCVSCRQQYCPSHRFPKDHTCPSLSVSNGKATASESRPKQPSAAAGAAALAAFKRAVPSTKSSTPTTVNSEVIATAPAIPKKSTPVTTSPASPSHKHNATNPFSKTDRSLYSSSTSVPVLLSNNDAIDAVNNNTHNNTNGPTFNDPPARCTPKPTTSRLPFVPPPLFGYA